MISAYLCFPPKLRALENIIILKINNHNLFQKNWKDEKLEIVFKYRKIFINTVMLMDINIDTYIIYHTDTCGHIYLSVSAYKL